MSKRIVLVLGAVLFAAAAHAQNLTLGNKLELNTLDPHFFASFAPNSSLRYFFDKLTSTTTSSRCARRLATSWKLVDDTTWEFKLRRDVKFHDGTLFTADDVIFTIDRVPNVPNSPNSFAQFTRGSTR
jgi:peptide/nickel transport system substrate-binding protein